MTVNQFMHRVKYDIILSSLDIPLTVNGKEVSDIEFVFGEHNEDGSYKDMSIDIKTETSNKESIKLDNSEYDYGHNVNHKEYYGG